MAVSSARVALNLVKVNTKRMMSNMAQFETLALSSPSEYVVHVELNRPKKLNAMNRPMWFEIGDCFRNLADNPDCRVIVLSGAGPKAFTAGIDLNDMLSVASEIAEHEDIARKAGVFAKLIRRYQTSLTALEKCPKPVIAAVHGACIGGGLNLVCAADIRYCSSDSYFQNKEVDIGMAADVGTLQRMPRIVGSTSLVNELAYTCRSLSAQEAKECGLVSSVFENKETLLNKAFEVAKQIAAKSPVAVQGTKRCLVYSRDHSVEDGLEYILMNNIAMLQSEDFIKAVTAQAMKDASPTFSKL